MNLALRPLRPWRSQTVLDWLPRLTGIALFIALCALATWWVLAFSAMRTIPMPKSARLAQTEATETGAAATLFGGSAQSGVRDVQLIGVVADLGNGTGAAILSLDGGPPKAVRTGTALSPQIRLTEIRGRAIVIERNGVRQEIALPVPSTSSGSRASAPTPPAPPSGAAAPLSTPAVPVTQPAVQPVQPAPAVQPAGGNPAQQFPGQMAPSGNPADPGSIPMERKE